MYEMIRNLTYGPMMMMMMALVWFKQANIMTITPG